MDRIYAQYGETGTYWDVRFDKQRLDALGVYLVGIDYVSVEVLADTGELRFNHGYEPGSPEHAAEKSLFDNYRQDIEQCLLERVRDDDPDYDAFRARHAGASPKR